MLLQPMSVANASRYRGIVENRDVWYVEDSSKPRNPVLPNVTMVSGGVFMQLTQGAHNTLSSAMCITTSIAHTSSIGR